MAATSSEVTHLHGLSGQDKVLFNLDRWDTESRQVRIRGSMECQPVRPQVMLARDSKGNRMEPRVLSKY